MMIIILICEHLLMTVTLLRVIWNGVNENKKHKNLKLQRVINGCVAYCVFSIIALVLFYYGNVVSYSYIYSVGIAIFIAFLINAACIVMYEQVQEHANVEIYARMAYMDTMTGFGNRTAFLEENKSNAVFPGMISYIMMDANNLKKINDSLGHNKGDEFVIILKNKTAEETEEIIRQVRAEIEFADEQSDIPISVAMGYAWTDAEEKNLPELIHCADEKMYRDKKRIKKYIFCINDRNVQYMITR